MSSELPNTEINDIILPNTETDNIILSKDDKADNSDSWISLNTLFSVSDEECMTEHDSSESKNFEKKIKESETCVDDKKPKEENRVAKRTNKENSIMFFDIVTRSAQLVKSEKGTRLMTIFEKIMALIEQNDDEKV